MSDKPKDGGPAFPTADGTATDGEKTVVHDSTSRGMSLRDWFAGQALAGIMADSTTTNGASFAAIAEEAYQAADAMLKARGA